jgi:hypothetical protein
MATSSQVVVYRSPEFQVSEAEGIIEQKVLEFVSACSAAHKLQGPEIIEFQEETFQQFGQLFSNVRKRIKEIRDRRVQEIIHAYQSFEISRIEFGPDQPSALREYGKIMWDIGSCWRDIPEDWQRKFKKVFYVDNSDPAYIRVYKIRRKESS